MSVDLAEYEGAYCDKETPGYYVIEKSGSDVLKIPKLEIEGDELKCDFIELAETFKTEDIEELIFITLLRDFCDRDYEGKAKFVKFHNLRTNDSWRIAYIY